MTRSLTLATWTVSSLWMLSLAGCAHEQPKPPLIKYVGSSTIAHFIRDAGAVYAGSRFSIDTEPESVGGEFAICEGRADLAGVAGRPRDETLQIGVSTRVIGKDAIAVIVHPSNPLENLTREQLAAIFSGKVRNWKNVGGRDLAIRPLIVGPESATRKVFRSAVLGVDDYAECEVVSPDSEIPRTVATDPGSIGQISFSFLAECRGVKRLAVDGQRAEPSNPHYPISRPLYLLWWPARRRVTEFVTWTATAEAEPILLRRFARVAEETSVDSQTTRGAGGSE